MQLPGAWRPEVQAAAMDMSAGFAKATKQSAPQAKIVHDKFHVTKHLNEAVDKVRRTERQALLAKGDESLKHTKYLWLQRAAVDGEQALDFEQLCQRELKTARAWAHKEMFAEFWEQPDAMRAHAFFRQWKNSAMRSKLEPLKKVARMLSEHHGNTLSMELFASWKNIHWIMRGTLHLLAPTCAGSVAEGHSKIGRKTATLIEAALILSEIEQQGQPPSLEKTEQIKMALGQQMFDFA